MIPSTVFNGETELTVTSIGERAFQDCTSLTSVTIPESVTRINNYAFNGCYRLKNFTVSSNLTSIGSSILGSCDGLSKVNMFVTNMSSFCNNPRPTFDSKISTNSRYLPIFLFDGNGNEIRDFTIPDDVTSISCSVFDNCSRLKSITFPSSITDINIDVNRFSNTYSLATVILEGPVPTIGRYFPERTVIFVPAEYFSDYQTSDIWKDMTLRILPDDTTTDYDITISAQDNTSALFSAIGEDNLNNVVNLKISGSINGYDVMIMRNKMLNLRHLDLSDANIVANNYEYYSGCHTEDNKLGDNMFCNLPIFSFKSPKTVTEMGKNVFSSCPLTDITLNEGLTNIGESAFTNCKFSNITLPNSIKDIGKGAFVGASMMNEIAIPEGVTKLLYGTFGDNYFCPLNKIRLPSTLEVIESSAFGSLIYGTNCLHELILPAGLKRIEGTLGKNRIIKEIHLPPMLEYVADGSFSSFYAITDYYVYVVDPIDINMSTFANYQTAMLHVPTQSYQNYYWNTQWSQFANLVEFDEPYSTFYIANDYTLADDKRFDGTPDAEFHNGSGFIVQGGNNQALDEVHVASDGTEAASVIDEGNITVNSMTFDIDIAKNKWYFFAFPFRVKVSDIMAPGYYALRWYDGVTRAANGQGGWKDYTGEYLEPGIGYIFQCNTAGTLHLPATSPTFNGQDKENVLEMHTAENDQDASWNFMGNPWLSYFDINDCEFDAPFTIWNGSGYDAYRPGDDDYLLHPFQAFFVQKPEGNNGLHFGHENRYTHHQGQNHMAAAHSRRMAKGINPSRLRLDMTISDGTNTDRTRVVFNSEKQNLYEVGTDAAKFMSANMPQLYTLDAKDVRYAINERPQGEVKLGFNAPTAGTYTIAIQRMDQPMLLRDMMTGRTVSLTDGDYTFDSEAGMLDNRFMLVMDNGTTGIAQLFAETGVSVIGADGGLYISGADKGEVNVYNTAGALVAQQAGNGHTALPRGAYIVKVNGVSVKVAVK